MKKIFLLPALIALGVAGCSIDPTRPIDFPPVDAMYATYDGPKLLISEVGFTTALPAARNMEDYASVEEKGRIRIEKSVNMPAPIALTDNSNQVLKGYLEKTGRFAIGSSVSDNHLKNTNLLKANLALPLAIDAALVKLESKVNGETHVAKVFGEAASITKTAVINLTVKDKLGNVLYIAEGKSVVNSAEKHIPEGAYLDDYVVDNALKNAVNDLSRAIDQGRIGSNKR